MRKSNGSLPKSVSSCALTMPIVRTHFDMIKKVNRGNGSSALSRSRAVCGAQADKPFIQNLALVGSNEVVNIVSATSCIAENREENEDGGVASMEPCLTFGGKSDIEMAGIYEEAFAAKSPGRVRFGEAD
jgi:hypothetical protein